MSKEPKWLCRVRLVFDNNSEEVVEEYTLPKISLAKLQSLWNQPESEPMLGDFELEDHQVPFFESILKRKLDRTKFSYFLSSYTSDFDAAKSDGGFMGQLPPPKTFLAFPDSKHTIPK